MRIYLMLILTLVLSATSAYASKKRKPDVYPATEEGPSEEVISSAPGYTGEPIEAAQPQAITPTPIHPRPKRTEARAAPQASPTGLAKYDAVPNSQAEPLIRRLRLTAELVTKYGRAYDYRVLTVTELQSILSQLDSESARITEERRQLNARAAAPVDQKIPAPESATSIGSEAPESPSAYSGGSTGADALAPNTP